MSHRLITAFRPLILLALLLASLSPIATAGASAAQSDRGLIDETSYQSPQFGYTVDWGDPWDVRERDVLTNPGGFDTITLRSLDGVMRISGRAETYDPLTFLQDTIAIQLASGGEVINLDSTATTPTAELQIGPDRMRLDVSSLPESGAIVLLSLRADERDYDAALASAEASIQVAGTPVFSSTAVAPTTEAGPTDTPPTEQTLPTEAPPTEQAAPTEALPTSTQEVLGSGVEGNTYTSPNFGFSIEWDESIWLVPDDAEQSEPDLDLVGLESATGPLTIIGLRGYNGSASTCLLGEQIFYSDPESGITDWEVAVDAEGNELSGREEGRSWGVYTNVYTNPNDPAATPREYVDYIECISLGDDESVVVIHAYAERDLYNEHIEYVLDVADSLMLPGGSPEPIDVATTAPSPAAIATASPVVTPPSTQAAPASTPAASAATDLTGGDSVRGETYAYSFSIPAEWQASESTLGSDIERTVLSNGTSTVAVEARAMPVPTLSDCVTNAAGEHEGQADYGDLALSRTASGDAFSGEDDFSAFANFTFTGPDDETWAHFIECRWIVEEESVLIVIQDVPQELFGSERAARRQIQNSIEVGP